MKILEIDKKFVDDLVKTGKLLLLNSYSCKEIKDLSEIPEELLSSLEKKAVQIGPELVLKSGDRLLTDDIKDVLKVYMPRKADSYWWAFDKDTLRLKFYAPKEVMTEVHFSKNDVRMYF